MCIYCSSTFKCYEISRKTCTYLELNPIKMEHALPEPDHELIYCDSCKTEPAELAHSFYLHCEKAFCKGHEEVRKLIVHCSSVQIVYTSHIEKLDKFQLMHDLYYLQALNLFS